MFETTLSDLIQKALRMVADWCRTVGLSINKRRTIPFLEEVVIRSNKAMFLGVTLDSKFLWNKHVQLSLNKATRRVMVQCRPLADTKWGFTLQSYSGCTT